MPAKKLQKHLLKSRIQVVALKIFFCGHLCNICSELWLPAVTNIINLLPLWFVRNCGTSVSKAKFVPYLILFLEVGSWWHQEIKKENKWWEYWIIYPYGSGALMQRKLNICFLESPGFVPPLFFRPPHDLFIVLEPTSVSKERRVTGCRQSTGLFLNSF